MKKPIVLLAAITLSTAAFAGNMQQDNKSGNSIHGNMNSMHKNMNSMHNGMEKEATQTGILKNKDMQRLHKEMTLNGMSEGGMEARLNMMGQKGRAYHQALKPDQKNTAG